MDYSPKPISSILFNIALFYQIMYLISNKKARVSKFGFRALIEFTSETDHYRLTDLCLEGAGRKSWHGGATLIFAGLREVLHGNPHTSHNLETADASLTKTISGKPIRRKNPSTIKTQNREKTVRW